MFEIKIRINGRTVRPNQFATELEKAMVADITQDVGRKVGRIRCSKHGQSPSIVASGRSLDQLSFDVSGCCDDLIKRVTSAL